MRVRIFVSIVVFFLSMFCFAIEPHEQQLIYSDSLVYDYVEALALESGIISLSSNFFPISIAELKLYLNDIDYNKLSPTGQKLFDTVIRELQLPYLGFSSSVLSFGIDPAIQPEFFFKTNSNVDWIHNYENRNKVISLPVRFSASRYVTIASDFYFGQNYSTAQNHSVFTNIPYTGSSFSAEFPMIAGLSAGAFVSDTPFINFQIGRGNISIFKTQMGSIVLSDELEGVNYARFSIFSPSIRYMISPIQLSVNKYLYLHQIDLRPIKRLSISVVEGVLVNAPMELRYFNPLMAFHNYSAWRSYRQYDIDNGGYPYPEGTRIGSQFAVQVNYNPWKFFRLYGVFTFNQYQTTYERNNYPETAAKVPNGIAFQVGIESFIPYKNGYWTFGAEYVYTSPWMYISESSNWSFYREYNELVGGGNVKNWTGFPYGPDVIASQIKLGYDDVNQKWGASFAYKLIVKGEQSFSLFSKTEEVSTSDGKKYIKSNYYPTSRAEAEIETPSGCAMYSHIFMLNGKYKIAEWCSLNGQIGYTYVLNNLHVNDRIENGFEASLSVKINNLAKIFAKHGEIK